jgi:hypothetical protein
MWLQVVTMSYAFFSEYNQRSKLNIPKLVYSGVFRSDVTSDVIIAECPLHDFKADNDDSLGWPFNLIGNYAGKVQVFLIGLPYSFVTGPGKGYVLDLLEYLKDQGYEENQILRVRFNQFGACVDGTAAFIVASRSTLNINKNPTVVEKVVQSQFPDIITHAHGKMGNVAFVGGAGLLNGFMKSNANPFPPLDKWGDNFLLCERKKGETILPSRLTPAEVGKIYGVKVKSIDDLSSLRKVIPNVVFETLTGIIFS